MAIDCSEENITLYTQEDVDGFQEVYGSCDTVTGNLAISGSMTHLDELFKLNRIAGNLTIEESLDLNDISGLALSFFRHSLVWVGVLKIRHNFPL